MEPWAKGSDHLKGSLGVGAVVVTSGGAEAPAMAAAKDQPGVPSAISFQLACLWVELAWQLQRQWGPQQCPGSD